MEPCLSSRFEEALIFATQLHAHQVRKSSQTPYIGHLLCVAGYVLEAGGDEDTVIAALLHDAVEDQGGLETLEEIRSRFGDRVANIVDECSDAYTNPKPPWQTRKETYLAHLPDSSPEAQLVSLADKLHNARSILRDLRSDHKDVWGKFNGGKSGTLWYYHSLANFFQQHSHSSLADELTCVVNEIERLSN